MLGTIRISEEHPWSSLFERRHEVPTYSSNPPFTTIAPFEYKYYDQLIVPPAPPPENFVDRRSSYAHYARYGPRDDWKDSNLKWNHTVQLRDVMAFRNRTAAKAQVKAYCERFSVSIPGVSAPSPNTRNLIYRYVDVIKNSFALLEAIHFELFMPDRPDLRFLVVQCSSVPTGTVEGDYFHLKDADVLPDSSFAINLGQVEYPVIWEVKQIIKITVEYQNRMESLAYVVKGGSGGEFAISDIFEEDLFIRDNLFPSQELRSEHSLVRVTSIDIPSTAQLFPVEPFHPPPPPRLTEKEEIDMFCVLSTEERKVVYSSCGLEVPSNPLEAFRRIRSDALLRVLNELVHKKRVCGEYLKLVAGVRTSSQRRRRVVTAVRELSTTDADWVKDRLGDFTKYGLTGDLELMNRYFRIGSRYRNRAMAGVDANDGDTKINESLVLMTLMNENKDMCPLENCRPLLNCIYGRRGGVVDSVMSKIGHNPVVTFNDGTMMRLNFAQSRAVRLYANKDGPRVFCVRSPPGSGKTLTAVAMASKIARSEVQRGYQCDVQLLLSVQNVAVDNMGDVLKKIGFGGSEVYNMKTKRLSPYEVAPYDFFDFRSYEELEDWRKGRMRIPNNNNLRNGREIAPNKDKKKLSKAVECIIHYRREFENTVEPKIFLATVEMVIHKMLNSILKRALLNVKRIIIDEASLLTEAALYAIIRRFPEARIVLIGDEQQLSPFQYDPHILGQELAGRSAISVAMKNGNMPIVEMNEVYRAPPSLVAPYNRLSYGGRLVANKAEGETPLCDIDLVPRGKPQLLLIDVDGEHVKNGRTKSLYNEKEMQTLQSLLRKFPHEWTKDIIIICLYKEQQWRLDQLLNKRQRVKQYNVLTVDSAQGKEAPIVIVMTTRTEKATDFFCCTNRCNVAVSRQQKALIILGKASLLTTNKPWSTVVNGVDFTRIKADEIM